MMKNNQTAAYAQLYKAFCEIENMPYPEWEAFIDRSEIVQLGQFDFFAMPNCLSTHSYFIIKGLVVSYREHNKEKSVHWVGSANDYVCSTDRFRIAFNEQYQIEGEIIVAVEETIAIRVTHSDMKWLEEHCAVFKRRTDVYVKQNFKLFLELDDIFIMPPKERYEKMQRAVNFGIERIPDVYLASWLCLTLGQLKKVRAFLKSYKG
ncbi:hypothetical protein GFS24_17730 [Chitinophaga sp. SYP-B3965]|uniref:hypothetical protein n=1 Tax=Chitinophaga sp. SYP-B3965 TaxID=2663120 RepID=UPI0012996F8A|nr:hypothetical protein [Chitinophaga sp. SYP-B3965]MRG46967.1 hypothetical protein [Chitinophaga sp. SYP-B3965]